VVLKFRACFISLSFNGLFCLISSKIGSFFGIAVRWRGFFTNETLRRGGDMVFTAAPSLRLRQHEERRGGDDFPEF
ncbi:MAG: hypothetical protein JW798_18235, partial [Prolixibacteraceae bacterium]|nr:hypothetical protein [Prolixibacteraceae bacterium]